MTAISALVVELSAERQSLEARSAALKKQLADNDDAIRRLDAQIEILERVRGAPPGASAARPKSRPISSRKSGRRRGHIAQAIKDLLTAQAGLTVSEIADRLQDTAQSTSAKPIRRVITNRLWMMRRAGAVVEQDGRIYLNSASGHS